MFNLDYDSIRYKSVIILMRDFLRLSSWSEGLDRKIFGPFFSSLWILCVGYI